MVTRDRLDRTIPKPYNNSDIDCLVEKLTSALHQAASKSCPKIKPRGRGKPAWWNEEVMFLRSKSRKQFNKAKYTRNEVDWEEYKVSLKMLKNCIRKAKRNSWKLFCSNIEDTSEASRLRKVLSSSPSIPSLLNRVDGTCTTSSEESLKELLDFHFPNCPSIAEYNVNLEVTPVDFRNNTSLVSESKIIWALGTFEPYKSPGPDGVIPADLQRTSDIILPWLKCIFESCIRLGYTPAKWKEVDVIFIPKAGKTSHTGPKDFRPITLSSFLLKTLERLIDSHIRSNIEPGLMSSSQHAYSKGKSVETALHSLVGSIEKSFEHKEYSLVAFMDIEGAFNNVRAEAIINGLANLKADAALVRLISHMLKNRTIRSKFGAASAQRIASRGTPQGGVLSPLLWNVVVNELLLLLGKSGFRVIAYADDVAIIVSGKFLNTISELLQHALSILVKWATNCGLSINPDKTELVLFTRKHNIPIFDPPVLCGTKLIVKESAKYLGLIIDRKLNWKDNLTERIKKSTIALYSCNKALGKKWGIQPRIAHWLYNAIIKPILLYGIIVWWPVLNKACHLKALEKVQRAACISISGALRSTPTAALEMLLQLTPLDILGKEMAANTAIRLKALSMWSVNKTGHSTILNTMDFIPEKLDYSQPTCSFERSFTTHIPDRNAWELGSLPNYDSIHFFTDGSKMESGVGGGVFSEQLNISESFRLPNHCSVFQAEITAIKEALSWLKWNVISSKDITIFSDSQAAIKALDSVFTSSRLVHECRSSLQEMNKHFNIQICWVPGHNGIPGNCRADELARHGTSLPPASIVSDIGMPLASCKWLVNKHTLDLVNARWLERNTCLATKQIWPCLSSKRSKELLSLNRSQIRTVIGVLTGHCLIGRHAIRMGVSSNDFCRSCRDEEEEETPLHLLGTCPALSRSRKKYLGEYFFNNLGDLADLRIQYLYSFIKSSYWFNEQG